MGTKKSAYGGVVLDDEGRILLRRVANNYKGYVWTFPKGRPERDEAPQMAALREVREETGYDCLVVKPLGDPVEGLETITTFFLMRPVHDHGGFHEETSEVRWTNLEEAHELLSLTEHETGRERDLTVLRTLQTVLG